MPEGISVTPLPNGPYMVRGATKVTRMSDGQEFPIEGSAALCRCGDSSNKPFCDGTHKSNGFTDAKQDDRVPDAVDDYVSEGGSLTIHDNRGRCAHAGVCTDNLKSVFKLKQEPWIDPDGATADEIRAVVQRCPSGALAATIDGDVITSANADTAMAFAPSGPYIVTGDVNVEKTDMPGGEATTKFTLCRCGQSKNKPFCNGAHWYRDGWDTED